MKLRFIAILLSAIGAGSAMPCSAQYRYPGNFIDWYQYGPMLVPNTTQNQLITFETATIDGVQMAQVHFRNQIAGNPEYPLNPQASRIFNFISDALVQSLASGLPTAVTYRQPPIDGSDLLVRICYDIKDC